MIKVISVDLIIRILINLRIRSYKFVRNRYDIANIF